MSVFTPVSAQQLVAHLQRYRIGELVRYQGIAAGVENTNFFVTTNRGEFVLTLFEAHSAEKLLFYLGLMEHLSEAGIPSIKPVHSQQAKLLHELNGKPASFVERIKGANPDKVSHSHCTQLGTMLAQFHLAAQSYPKQMENEFDLAWQQRTIQSIVHQLPASDARLLQRELAYQADLHAQIMALPAGIIHGDLFRDNTLFISQPDGKDDQQNRKQKVTLSAILDLYTACNDALLVDIAIVINDWCFQPDGAIDEPLTHALISAYQTIRPLQESEKKLFNAVLRASALRFWVLRLGLKYTPRSTCNDRPKDEQTRQYDPDEYKQKLLKHIECEAQIVRLLFDD